MTKGKALKAGLWYTISNILLKGIVFITLPIFTRLLSTEEFGLYNTYSAYQSIVTVFTGICLYGSLRTAKYDYKDKYDEYSGSILFLSGFALFIMMLLSFVFYGYIKIYWEFDRIILFILLLHSYAMFIFQYYNTLLALKFEYKQYIIISFFNTFFNVFLSIILILTIFSDKRDIGRIIGFASPPIIIASIIWIKSVIYNLKNNKKLINISIWKYGLALSLPLVIHTFAQQLLAQFGRIMINKIIGAEAAGIYGFTFTIVTILQIIILSMDSAWSAWFYDQLSIKDYKTIKKLSNLYIILMLFLYSGFITVVPEVIKIMAPTKYWSGIYLIIPLSFSMIFVFLYSLPVHIEYFYKKTKFIAIGTTLATVLNVILNTVFIPIYGFNGAAGITIVSYVILFIFHWVIAKKIDNNKMFSKTVIGVCILLAFIYSVITNIFIESFIMRYGSLLIFYTFYYLIFGKKLKPFIKEYIKKK
ncbi:oligosaccharide flippase family protein [Clostridium intestinale]|uniref:lipopolysaccharide biosynthesis protein n=1 Tax=Clostridium intestinale TaxID=36845 RepID=UPI0028E7525B|nr:oligosaccharide flippase family protein [Clostridium intestinale]